ncbi:MAG: glycoside hydrolase family 32 protein [Bacteroidota bacterium]|nr:glycoside hydrolase family 32 protein [Bacteroidota bacterium]
MKVYGLLVFAFSIATINTSAQEEYSEPYRPQVHFSPKQKWMNDPNGMVYFKGVYHLFFQYYPDSTVWGPMHWGHAISKDLIHWQQQPIALYPDSLGYIFSGSAVVDKNNTSGFGINGKVPIVAVFTHHDPKGEKEGKTDFQNESLAYSLDAGKTWVKYAHNPVLKNPGITDFRDPKVMWYEPGKKWVMTLATKDRITFYSSPDLKNWRKESEFGKNAGAHGGVWECPDLFTLDDHGKKIWVLIVNLNPGGPNKGSATQYFVGNFDGNKFASVSNETKWLDFGPDEYAGVTWNNTGNRRIFLGWMSNWIYANVVPTKAWRNAMTIPRELKLEHSGKNIYLTSEPVSELSKIEFPPVVVHNLHVTKSIDISEKTGIIKLPCRINLDFQKIKDFSIVLSNEKKEEIIIGYDKKNNRYFIDRTHSGKTDFQKDFASIDVAPRLTGDPEMNMTLIIDVSSIELFADDGLTVMTEIFFPDKIYNQLHIQSPGDILINKLEYQKLKSIWK